MDRWSTRLIPAIAITVGALLCCALAIGSLERGPWYDEFYTRFVTRPDIGWGRALRESWLADNHPPLYYLIARATAWTSSIETHRLVNIALGLFACIGGWIVTRGRPSLATAAVIALVVIAANEWTPHVGTELRSYFLSLCAGALLALCLAALWEAPEERVPGRAAVYALTVLVAFNTHIITTIACGALIAPFVLLAALRRDGVRLRVLLPAPLLAGLAFVGVTAIQLPYWEQNTQVFWLPTGFTAGRYAIQLAVQRTLEANLPVTFAAVAGGVLLLREAIRARSVPEPLVVLILLGTGLALGIATLLAIQIVRPILVERYLMGTVGAVAVALALGASRALCALPQRLAAGGLVLSALLSLWSLHTFTQAAIKRNSWYGTGALIAQVAARCPDATVHTDPFWNSDVMAMSPADNARVIPFAYHTVATHFGFRLQSAPSRRLSVGCPNLFWAEHDTKRRFDEASVLAHLRNQGFALSRIHMTRVGDGFIASDRPLTR